MLPGTPRPHMTTSFDNAARVLMPPEPSLPYLRITWSSSASSVERGSTPLPR